MKDVDYQYFVKKLVLMWFIVEVVEVYFLVVSQFLLFFIDKKMQVGVFEYFFFFIVSVRKEDY